MGAMAPMNTLAGSMTGGMAGGKKQGQPMLGQNVGTLGLLGQMGQQGMGGMPPAQGEVNGGKAFTDGPGNLRGQGQPAGQALPGALGTFKATLGQQKGGSFMSRIKKSLPSLRGLPGMGGPNQTQSSVPWGLNAKNAMGMGGGIGGGIGAGGGLAGMMGGVGQLMNNPQAGGMGGNPLLGNAGGGGSPYKPQFPGGMMPQFQQGQMAQQQQAQQNQPPGEPKRDE